MKRRLKEDQEHMRAQALLEKIQPPRDNNTGELNVEVEDENNDAPRRNLKCGHNDRRCGMK
jgi:hypothetical protein